MAARFRYRSQHYLPTWKINAYAGDTLTINLSTGLKLGGVVFGCGPAGLALQSRKGDSVTTVTITGKRLQIEARLVSGTYQRTRSTAGEITGVWNEGNDRLPLTFQRIERDQKEHQFVLGLIRLENRLESKEITTVQQPAGFFASVCLEPSVPLRVR